MKACGAKTRSGGRCKKPGMANNRCRLHGGLTPIGPASPHWKTGKHSKWGALPRDLAERYAKTTSLADAELMAVTQELALVDARASQIIASLGTAGDTDVARWAQILELFEMRRRLVDVESRRRKDAQEMMSIRQVMAIVSIVGTSVIEHVRDPKERMAVMNTVQRILRPLPETQTVAEIPAITESKDT